MNNCVHEVHDGYSDKDDARTYNEYPLRLLRADLVDLLPAMRRRASAHAETAMLHIEIVDDFGFPELLPEMKSGLEEVLEMYAMIDELESAIHRCLRRWTRRLRRFAATHVYAQRSSRPLSLTHPSLG